MFKRSLRILCMLLVVALLTNMLPMTAWAAGLFEATETPYEELDLSNARIVEEVEANRTEYSKEFKLNNGMYVSAVYKEPVHYMSNGRWEEIDNTLIARTDGTFTNTAGVWDVQLPQMLTSSSAVTITKDGYTLSFRLTGELRQSGSLMQMEASQAEALTRAGETFTISSANGTAQTFAVHSAQTAQGHIQALDFTQAKEQAAFTEFVAEKNVSQLLYSGIYENTNIQYDLRANTVKESIILSSYDSVLRGYRYTLNAGDMIPVLQADNSIYFYDAKQENVVMVMPAPYLVDSAYAVSYDVSVNLKQEGTAWTLSYILPQQWLSSEERAWPVVLDPAVEADLSGSNMQDTTILSARPSEANYSRATLQVGYSNNDGVSRVLLVVNNLPELKSSDVIVKATISLYKPYTNASSTAVTVHNVTEQWSIYDASWNHAPSFDATAEDYVLVAAAGRPEWDITNIARQWYEGENYGLLFKSVDQAEASGNGNTWKEFYSCNFGNATTDPALTIYFRENSGLESYWDYTAVSAGWAGTGYINNYTGNLTWVHDAIGFGGNRMPVSISNIYNASDASNNTFGMGNGWRTNYHQRVYQFDQDSDYYIWEDGDGTQHYFKHASSNKYKDEDGLELELTTHSGQAYKFKITDKGGNKSYFDTEGRLYKIENNQQTKSSINITYMGSDGYRISTITDGAGRLYRFLYSNDYLEQIVYCGTGSTYIYGITYSYSGTKLTAICSDVEGWAEFYYNGNLLDSVYDYADLNVEETPFSMIGRAIGWDVP